MPPPEDNIRTGSEDRDVSQPPPLAKTFWKTFLEKMAITVRLFGKDVYRKKLQWFDLKRADYRLGKKAYETQSSMSDQNQTSDRISEIQNQIKALGDPESSAPSSKQKIKNLAKGAGRAMNIQILKFKRNHLFRKLGGKLRQIADSDASLTTEAQQCKSVSAKIDVLNSEIRTLAAGTYVLARKPLITGSLVLILIAAFAAVAYEQGASPASAFPGGAKKDAAVWAANYRSATFITGAAFFKRIGPVHLLVRDGLTVSDHIKDIAGIVTEAAAKHGVTITSKETDIQLVVMWKLTTTK